MSSRFAQYSHACSTALYVGFNMSEAHQKAHNNHSDVLWDTSLSEVQVCENH